MMRPIGELRIHLGAHKTATTHVQDSLLAHRSAIARAGVDYIPREEFGPLQRRFSNPENWRKRLWSKPIEGMFLRRFGRLRNGSSTVLLSDEDLLGYSYDLFSSQVYSEGRGLHIVRALARESKVALFLGIRSFDQILPSAYAQTIKAIAPAPGWLNEIRKELVASPPSWLDLVSRLQSEFPMAQLKIWTQEDYRHHSQEILTFLVGRDVGHFPAIAPPQRTTSPSNEAISAAEQLDPYLPMNVRRAQVRKIFYEDLPAGDGRAPFSPLSKQEVNVLRDRYEADRDELLRSFPGLLFTPTGALQSGLV